MIIFYVSFYVPFYVSVLKRPIYRKRNYDTAKRIFSAELEHLDSLSVV